MDETDEVNVGAPPTRPKPATSHTEIRDGRGERPPVPPRPAANTTEIWEGGVVTRGESVALVVLVVLVALIVSVALVALAVLGLRLQAWLLELVGICG